ncbi:MAG: glycosyl hydrolase family 18 protein [Methanoregula sp.]|jgi:hypothetical protein|uniref:glycosyl hydrolase family 18 protein n=1 Tax=Methanoregula sp. TaxID=2052170 RepID=UPI003D139CEB
MKIMHRKRICPPDRFLLITIVFLIGCFTIAAFPAAAESDGSIRIYSNPPGSGACLDSTDSSGNCIAFDSSGFTEFYNIAGGSSHTVSVFLDGYQTFTTTVYVPEGQEVEVHAELQPMLSATTSPTQTPATTTTPDFLQGLITAIRNLFSGGSSGNTNSQSQAGSSGTPGSGSGTFSGTATTLPTPAIPGEGPRVIAAYFYLFDPAYDAAISVQDQIPWKKVNRVYIGFATVRDGVLADLPAGSSAEETAQREVNEAKIRNVIALCRQGNPEAEIFITSNFGEGMDDQYLQAAQDPRKFADSVVTYLKEYGLDGYDMDWESRQIDDYAPQLTSLLSTCHATFAAAGNNPHGRPFGLTHTVWPGVESAQTVAGLKDSVDQINIMSYGPGDTYDLASCADTYYQAGFPYGKMIGGVESESGYPESGGPDTQASVAAKCAYVKENNLAGLFEWRMDNDMRINDGPPTFQVTGWMSDCLAG